MCTEMVHDWELYSDHQDVDPEVVRQNTEMAQGILTWMRKLDLSPREPIATDESTEAHDCEDTYSNSQNTTVQIQQLLKKCTQYCSYLFQFQMMEVQSVGHFRGEHPLC